MLKSALGVHNTRITVSLSSRQLAIDIVKLTSFVSVTNLFDVAFTSKGVCTTETKQKLFYQR